AGFFEGSNIASKIELIFDYTQPIGMVIYVALIIAFTYFYTFVQVNPEQMAENLQKQGGYIPGIRPGDRKSTRLNSSHVSSSYAVIYLHSFPTRRSSDLQAFLKEVILLQKLS